MYRIRSELDVSIRVTNNVAGSDASYRSIFSFEFYTVGLGWVWEKSKIAMARHLSAFTLQHFFALSFCWLLFCSFEKNFRLNEATFSNIPPYQMQQLSLSSFIFPPILSQFCLRKSFGALQMLFSTVLYSTRSPFT